MPRFIIENNDIPKYQQIVNGILAAIENGDLNVDDKLPSIKELTTALDVSPDTVMAAYNQLKSRDIVTAVVGKGYYVARTKSITKHRVFLLFDSFTAYKEDLYNAINDAFMVDGLVEIFFHHNNPKSYKKLLAEAEGSYTSYIIMPIEDEALDSFLIDLLPPKNVYILDKGTSKLKKKFPHVVQDFVQDIQEAFTAELDRIKKYSAIKFINASNKPHILEIGVGLEKFAKRNRMDYQMEGVLTDIALNSGDLFVVIEDKDLVDLIERSAPADLVLGQDIGLVSYNETYLKKVIAGGITTISTDFSLMGTTISDLVKRKGRERIFNPARLIVRASV